MRSACMPFRSVTLRGCALAARRLVAQIARRVPVVSGRAALRCVGFFVGLSAFSGAAGRSVAPPPAPPKGGYARLPVRPAVSSVWRSAVSAVHLSRPAGRPLTPPAARALRAW